ncbi:MAG: hypothetical protein KIT83_17070 [Bryobacterales bacterium]|nr:hypothetical protein [Bryobacterales bacterium]
MWKGCLVLLGVLVVALYWEHQMVTASNIPNTWIVVGLLAGSVTATVGGLQGVIAALRTRLNPETEVGNWQDGQKVRVGGVVQPKGAALKTPFWATDAVVMEFEMSAANRAPEESSSSPSTGRVVPPSVRGIDAVPFGIVTSHGFVAVSGSPWLKNFRPTVSVDQRYQAPALHLLTERKWQIADFEMGNAIYEQYLNQQDQDVHLYLANRRAVSTLFAPVGQPTAGWIERQAPPQLQGQQAVDAIAQRLASRRWRFKEFTLQPGAEVTVEGTFMANPPRIEVGRWMLDGSAMNAVRPGLAAKTAASQWWQALVFTVAVAALTVAMHYLVYAESGRLYRNLVEWAAGLPG